MKVVSSKQMRQLEQAAIEDFGIPSVLLMENAAICLAKHCFRLIDGIRSPKILIVCGAGNNGGDGMALARHLHIKGIETKIVYVGSGTAGRDAAVNLAIVKKLGIPVQQCAKDLIQNAGIFYEIENDIKTYDLVVDAMLGTGLDRNVDGSYKHLAEMINRYAKYVLSVDIPTGVHSDTGRIMDCAVQAAETVTFCSPKIGLYAYPGAVYAGKIHVEDISIPHSLIDIIDTEAEILTDKEAADLLPVRTLRSNKSDFGKVIVFAGSNEMPGAAALTCSASYKAGAGLIRACVLPRVADAINHWQREVITHNVPEKDGKYFKNCIDVSSEEISQADVIVIGPGIGRGKDVTEFVHEIIKSVHVPLVLDADALFAVSEDISILKQLKAPCVITPHPGEMNRLTGLPVSEILLNTIDTAVRFAKEFNVVTLLKDAHTIIANPNGKYYINTTGNNSLSKAGTGDVLTGIIAGFIAQGSDIFTASVLGAYYHGKAGESAALKKTSYGVMAEDVLAEVACIIGKNAD